MNTAQQHIINKVIVDVNTKSKKTAFTLKDNLDVFLKEDIFPYMEAYFKTLEEKLPSEIIQIPKLVLEVTGDSENNFEALKKSIKSQINKEIEKIINNPSSASNDVVFLSTAKSKEEAFIYFLERGIIPWWETIDRLEVYSEETLIELTKSNSFKTLFKRKIEVLSTRVRLVKQFSNVQIIKLLQGVFNNEIITLFRTDKTINQQINQLNPKYRQWIWQEIIQYCLDENKDNLVSKLSLVLESKLTAENDKIVEVSLLVLKTINDKTESEFNPVKTIKTDNNSDKNNSKKETTLKQNLEIKENYLEEKVKENNAIVNQQEKLQEDSIIENTKEAEKHSAEILNDKTKASKKIKETFENTRITEDSKVVKNTKTSEENREKQEHSEAILNNKTEASKETKGTQSKNKKALENNIENKLEKNATDNTLQTKAKEDEVVNNKKQLEDEAIDLKTKKSSQEKSTKEEATSSPETSKTLHNPNENAILEASEINKTVSELIKDEALEKHFKKENKGDYYVKNAGLIILHPYLKNFFANCELLNDSDKIIDPELAIHLLHYLATKKEQQYESNMVFEKFLCGIDVTQSIRREVIIPEALKQKAEGLLEAVIIHWEALNNPSTDLLRNEFLQRAGKLSFKKDNPKIIVERKVFDLLLDKLPWTLSLSKLPWIDKLIYTDW